MRKRAGTAPSDERDRRNPTSEERSCAGGATTPIAVCMQLLPHPDTAVATVQTIDVAVWTDGDRWHFRYLVEGAEDLILPDARPANRTEGLWKQTCFEAFVRLSETRYIELNFSPSGQWAAYRFDDYRSEMRDEAAEVEIWLDAGESWLALEAAVTCKALTAGSSLGLSAVIKERDSTSYWALGHPDGRPDFHDQTCFRALLADIAHS